MTFGKKLTKLRTAKKMTQKDVAALMGVNNSTYSRYEKDQLTPTAEKYEKLAKILGCETSYLTEEIEKAAEKKAAVKKQVSAKKSATKKTSEKKAMAPKAAPVNPSAKTIIEVQYAGKSLNTEDIIKRVKSESKADKGDISIYIKPEENRVYYVVNGESGSFEI
ncbi:MAG: helix-turn-helix domain-containing protein [Lachnospiraceae bacterium]|nr:helix-turn-helix domain-containing protein [Lachnospiraceae bacterium]